MKYILFFLCFGFISKETAYSQFVTYESKLFYNENYKTKLTVELFDIENTNNRLHMPSSRNDIDLKSLQNLALSKLYANTAEWTLENFQIPDSDYAIRESKNLSKFESYKSLNPEKEYIVPVTSFTYMIKGQLFGNLLFLMKTESLSDPIPLWLNAVYVNDKWKINQVEYTTGVMDIIVTSFCHTFFESLNLKTQLSEPMQKVRDKVLSIDNMSFDFAKLADVAQSSFFDNVDSKSGVMWTSTSDYIKLPNHEYSKKIHIDIEIPILVTSYTDDYKIRKNDRKFYIENQQFYLDKINLDNREAEETVIDYINKSPEDTLFFLRKISFYEDSIPVAIIRYKLKNKDNTVVVEEINNRVIVTNNPKYNNLILIVKTIKPEYWRDFWNLNSRIEAVTKYHPEYNFKMLNLNINHLAEIFRRNPKDLEPYCDFD